MKTMNTESQVRRETLSRYPPQRLLGHDTDRILDKYGETS